MDNETILKIFGWAVIVGISLVLPIRYLLTRSDLITSFNAFLVGMIPFVGSSAIACADMQVHYGNYSTADYHRFYLIFGLFLIAFVFTYFTHRPRAMLVKHLAAEPRKSRQLPFFLAIVAVSLVLFRGVVANAIYIPFVNELVSKITLPGVAFATIFVFGSWRRDRQNMLLLALFGVILVVCLAISIMSGGGRRHVMSVLVAVAVYSYWNELRRKNKTQVLVVSGIFGSLLFVIIMTYSEMRHFDRGASLAEKRTLSKSMEVLTEMPTRAFDIGNMLTGRDFHNRFGQNAVNCSLYLIELDRRGIHGHSEITIPDYFFTVRFLVSNPVPRSIWPKSWGHKPDSLGYALPKHYNSYYNVNWGPGIVGHAVHEGGWFMALIYGWFFAVCFKSFDAALTMNPTNLLLNGLLAALIPQIMVLVRGDQGVALLNMIFSYLFYLLIRVVAEMLYGRESRGKANRIAYSRQGLI